MVSTDWTLGLIIVVVSLLWRYLIMIDFIKSLTNRKQLIIDGNICDIKKSQKVITFFEWEKAPCGQLFKVKKTLYRTVNGNWFWIGGNNEGRIVTEEYVKERLEECNAVTAYVKYFGELEEA